eukprot:4774972-Pyramimonas_sp.AAC.1
MWSQPLRLSEAFCGSPYGAAKRRIGWRGTHVVTATGAFSVAGMGLRSAVLDGAGRMLSQPLWSS